MNRNVWSILVLTVLLLPLHVCAQQRVEYSQKAEDMFNKAVGLYRDGKYQDASAAFGAIIQQFPNGQRITAAYVMKAKALFRAYENYEASKTVRAFLAQFPRSMYVPDAELVMGQVYNRIERYSDAVESFLHAWQLLPDTGAARLQQDLLQSLDTTVDHHLALADVHRFIAMSTGPEQRAFFWMKAADKEIASGNIGGASIALDSIVTRYPDAISRDRIDRLRLRISGKSTVKIAALLPLMQKSDPSALKEIGNEVYEGVLLAVEQYAADPFARVKVSLETRDTQREVKLAGEEAQELVNEKDVVAIVGPVFSATTTAAAKVANAGKVPLITPTANTNGVAAVGPYVFQANPDYEARGRAMAHYAVKDRNFTTLAVLAPSDAYGKYLAEGFISEAQKLGARVVATEWYQKGTGDLKTQLGNIRRAGFVAAQEPLISFGGKLKRSDVMRLADAGVPLRRLDSLMNRGSTVSAAWLLGPHGRRIVDSLGLKQSFDDSAVDSLDIPVTAINALYIPIGSPEEIGVVSSQVVYFNLHTQVLGSGEWNNLGELDGNKRYTRGIQFEADSYIDTSSAAYVSFVNSFVGRFKKQPGRDVLYGYDTAKMLLSIIGGGVATRDALTRALGNVRDYQGVHSRIGFTKERVNPWVHILQYTSDGIQRVGEASADE